MWTDVASVLKRSDASIRLEFNCTMAGLDQMTEQELIAELHRLAGEYLDRQQMDLTPEQQQVILGWADQTAGLLEVRLFGSCARGNSRPDDPVSLAVTIGGVGIGDPLTLYLIERSQWEAELA